MADRVDYDEFGLFHENAAEYGLPYDGPPAVRRVFAEVAPGRRLSALAWQDSDAELVLLHGGAQNAHTWDTVALALGRPLVAIDLPGHGHSDGPGDRPEGQLNAVGNAVDVAAAVRQLAPRARAVVGMSLGGLTTIALTAAAPELVRKVVLVDIVPGTKPGRSRHITDFVNGPPSFASLDELLERTARFNPGRSRSSLRRGILHNAEQQPDGTWVWRWARHRTPPAAPAGSAPGGTPPGAGAVRYDQLWDAVSAITVPVLLARGMRPDSVLGDEQEAELRRRLPAAQIVHVAGAGHSLQGDTPLELAGLIRSFVFGP
ncbi:MAG TPA: alpha/beta hydrolase [Streptosporangiaceae bacterium]|nr:alpha/beta hydrolase [Streptosporangiaceae bacterium]